ncbi:hypothetical protein AB7849_02825 [Rhodanobacter sp. 115]|nr:hypothetical protein [Rhodanobacter sp. 115]
MSRSRLMPFAMIVSIAMEGVGVTGAKGCAPVTTWSQRADPNRQPL